MADGLKLCPFKLHLEKSSVVSLNGAPATDPRACEGPDCALWITLSADGKAGACAHAVNVKALDTIAQVIGPISDGSIYLAGVVAKLSKQTGGLSRGLAHLIEQASKPVDPPVQLAPPPAP
jgi:hypothetical protein